MLQLLLGAALFVLVVGGLYGLSVYLIFHHNTPNLPSCTPDGVC